MLCNKCKKKSCSGCGSSVSQTENQISQLQDAVNTLTENLKAFLCGNPILLVQTTKDIACFDINTGLGAGCWDGWAICDGAQHPMPSNPKLLTQTPNFVDRFIVQATGNYLVNDTGGLDEVILTTPQLPAHTHTVNDAGHTHAVTDPGHDHPVTDPGHGHGGSGGSHTHTFSTNSAGFHEHSTGVIGITDGGGGTGANVRTSDAIPGNATTTDGLHSHTGTTDPSASGITIGSAFTGVDVTDSFTGITIASSDSSIIIDPEGNGDSHENRPPYYACLYVIKL